MNGRIILSCTGSFGAAIVVEASGIVDGKHGHGGGVE